MASNNTSHIDNTHADFDLSLAPKAKERLSLIEREEVFKFGHADPRARGSIRKSAKSIKAKEAEDLAFLLDEEVLAPTADGGVDD